MEDIEVDIGSVHIAGRDCLAEEAEIPLFETY